jgi:hypothetical protein
MGMREPARGKRLRAVIEALLNLGKVATLRVRGTRTTEEYDQRERGQLL